ncbi:MAG: hypothetical protein RMZ69_07175 [Nostoc sp. ChiQUE01a]|nr:hypothetical protein [Nostoc sp. DedQUE01]MDZ8236940.1 hypothetical protein [Nostoc sp. ChiQUE01a]
MQKTLLQEVYRTSRGGNWEDDVALSTTRVTPQVSGKKVNLLCSPQIS